MAKPSTADPIDGFTLQESRLLARYYTNFGIDEISILLGKSRHEVEGLAKELKLKKKEVHHG